MKLLFFLLLLLAESCGSLKCNDLLDLTNPFIGSGGLGYGYGGISPAASFPRGALRLGPDTASSLADTGFQHFSGYFYEDSMVRMFSHTHYVGAGINGLGAFGVMPSRKPEARDLNSLQAALRKDHQDNKGKSRLWWSKMDKASEMAHPGFYQVTLSDSEVTAQMVATSRLTAIHRYTWEQQQDAQSASGPRLIIDLLHGSHLEDAIDDPDRLAKLTVAGDGASFSGSFVAGPGGTVTYIYGELRSDDVPLNKLPIRPRWLTCTAMGTTGVDCQSSRGDEGQTFSSDGGMLLSVLSFDDELTEVELHVSLSFISEARAQQSLQEVQARAQAQAPTRRRKQPQSDDRTDRSDDSVSNYTRTSFFSSGSRRGSLFQLGLTGTRQAWCDELEYFSFVALEGDAALPELLHTANFRTRMTPAVYTEGESGLYRGFDGAVHNATAERASYTGEDSRGASKAFYSDLSLWDTHRSQNPWLLLTDQPVAVGILRSFAEITVQQGAFPKWTTANHEVGCMVGVPGAALVLDAATMGLAAKFNLAAIQQALQRQATQPDAKNGRKDVEFYLEHGYVSAEEVEEGSSHTLSYAFDDYLLAGISMAVGAEEDSAAAARRANNYRNIFDSSAQLMCPKSASGEISCSSEPQRDFKHYIEGNALHWTYFVPHDVDGLKSLYASDTAFESGLEAFFEQYAAFQTAYGTILPNPYYWGGNEVCMLTPWLFNFGKQCHLSQRWSRSVAKELFTTAPSGIPGNDDYASMSSWLLFASLGVYPMAGQGYFMVGSPRVKEAALRLTHLDGATSMLTIRAYNNSAENVYVQKLLVNGRVWTSPRLPSGVLADPGGCMLEFFMAREAHSTLCE
jgi:predicted alpha-1,2-mannosidase